MKFYEIAYKNVRGNLYRYVMYYLSNVFSVMLFFIFANFIFHPVIQKMGASNSQMLSTIGMGLTACEYVIIIFSFFFVSYSNSTFIKSRGREFGLLSLFGMTKGQIRKYVAYENITVSLLSIIAGTVLGGLFSKLFFMLIESVLGEGPVIPFMIVPQAVLVTFISFFVLFQIISMFSLMRINSKTIVTQLKSTKIPKAVPKFSKPLAILGVLMVAAGYALAWFSNMLIIFTMFPILGLTVAGTYLLLNQFSIAVTKGLQQNKRIFYKKTNMIVISQIIYKLRDNAKVLFLIAILGAVTLTSAGTLYSLFDAALKTTLSTVPQHISLMEKGGGLIDTAGEQKIEDILDKDNIKISSTYKIQGFKGTWKLDGKETGGNIFVMSCSDYNVRAKVLGLKTLDLKGTDIAVAIIYPYLSRPEKISININGPVPKEQITESFYGKVISNSSEECGYAAVLSDDYYYSIKKTVPENDIYTYYGYDLKNWQAANDAMIDIRNGLPKEDKDSFYELITGYTEMVKSQALTMLIGLFVALLFLIATGSIIYFKLFSELQKDRDEYAALMKMGMSRKEMKRIVNTQLVVIFFLPFVIATAHASFALKTLSDILQSNLVAIGLTVILAYLVFQIIYFLIINIVYKSQISTIE